jgi:hypothetical protein
MADTASDSSDTRCITGGLLPVAHAEGQLELVGSLLLDFQLTGSNLLDEAATMAAGVPTPLIPISPTTSQPLIHTLVSYAPPSLTRV